MKEGGYSAEKTVMRGKESQGEAKRGRKSGVGLPRRARNKKVADRGHFEEDQPVPKRLLCVCGSQSQGGGEVGWLWNLISRCPGTQLITSFSRDGDQFNSKMAIMMTNSCHKRYMLQLAETKQQMIREEWCRRKIGTYFCT